jgi:hypothetical protein
MFSTQQQTAAANIQRAFLRLRYAILKSQCQAGKTGAYQALINLMLNAEDAPIQRAYVLCGSHETELRKQARKDALKYNREACEEGKIQVLFRQDFEGATMDITNALIIVDESHMDQGKGQQLDKFLRRHGISGLDGNPATLIAKNTYIVSVDATPYSELAALAHKETPYEKHIEELQPGESYVGIGHYLYTGLLKGTFDISQNKKDFVALFPSDANKYALIRLSAAVKGKSNAQEVAVEKLAAKKGWQVLYYTAAQTDIAITKSEQRGLAREGKEVLCLEDEPDMPTVVLIRGRLRAGKVVPKKHIAFVWEGAKTSKTDALVQGLAGRMCGYSQSAGADEDPMKLDADNLPTLFVPPSALERHEKKVVKSSEMERAILSPDLLPTNATNLKKPHVDSIATRVIEGEEIIMTPCVPIRIKLPTEDDDTYHGIFDAERDERINLCRKELLKAKNLDLIRNSQYLTAEQKEEILNHARTAPARVRNIREANADAHHQVLREVIKAYAEKTAAPNHIVSQHDYLNFIITHPCLKKVEGANPRYLYVVFYTRASAGVAWVKNAHHNSRIPKTNGKSIFSFSEAATDVPLVAAGATGFSEAHLKAPENFEQALMAYLSHWRDSGLTTTREIQSTKDRFSLDKRKFHFVSTKDNDVRRICERVGSVFSVKMNIKFTRGTAGAKGHFNVKSIAW